MKRLGDTLGDELRCVRQRFADQRDRLVDEEAKELGELRADFLTRHWPRIQSAFYALRHLCECHRVPRDLFVLLVDWSIAVSVFRRFSLSVLFTNAGPLRFTRLTIDADCTVEPWRLRDLFYRRIAEQAGPSRNTWGIADSVTVFRYTEPGAVPYLKNSLDEQGMASFLARDPAAVIDVHIGITEQ
jgi:hypothetical protein